MAALRGSNPAGGWRAQPKRSTTGWPATSGAARMAAAKPTGSFTRHGPVSRAATVANDAAGTPAGDGAGPPAGMAPNKGVSVARPPAAGWRDMAAARAWGSSREAEDWDMPVPYGAPVTVDPGDRGCPPGNGGESRLRGAMTQRTGNQGPRPEVEPAVSYLPTRLISATERGGTITFLSAEGPPNSGGPGGETVKWAV